MAFKKITVGGIENLVEFDLGSPIEGTFLGSKKYTAKDGEIYDLGVLKTVEGEKVFFLGGQLAFLLGQVKTGDKVRITYQGLTNKPVQTKKGGLKQIHQYKLEVDA